MTVTLFPSTRTDYILMNQQRPPYNDVHVRRAISYAIDRESLVKAVLFGNGTAANSLFMPTVPYYDKNTPGQTFDMAKAKAEMAMSSVPTGFTTTYLASSGDSTDAAIAQVLQASLQQLGITMNITNSDPSAVHDLQTSLDYEISHSYWTMDIADPDELVQFAVLPERRRQLLQHQLQQQPGAGPGAPGPEDLRQGAAAADLQPAAGAAGRGRLPAGAVLPAASLRDALERAGLLRHTDRPVRHGHGVPGVGDGDPL